MAVSADTIAAAWQRAFDAAQGAVGATGVSPNGGLAYERAETMHLPLLRVEHDLRTLRDRSPPIVASITTTSPPTIGSLRTTDSGHQAVCGTGAGAPRRTIALARASI